MPLIGLLAAAALAQPMGNHDKTMYRWEIGGGVGWDVFADGPAVLLHARDTPSPGVVRGLDLEGGVDRFGANPAPYGGVYATYDRGLVHNGLQGLFVGPRAGFRYVTWRDEVELRGSAVDVGGHSAELHVGAALSARWIFHPGSVIGVEIRPTATVLGFGATPAVGEIAIRFVAGFAQVPFGPAPMPR